VSRALVDESRIEFSQDLVATPLKSKNYGGCVAACARPGEGEGGEHCQTE